MLNLPFHALSFNSLPCALSLAQGIRETASRMWTRATTAQTGHLSARCRLFRATLTNSQRLNTMMWPPPAESQCWPRPFAHLPRRPRLSPGTRRHLGSPWPRQSHPTLTPPTLPGWPLLLPTDCHRPRGRRHRLLDPPTSPRSPPPPCPHSSQPRPTPRPRLCENPPLPHLPLRLSVLPLSCRRPRARRPIRRCPTASTGC